MNRIEGRNEWKEGFGRKKEKMKRSKYMSSRRWKAKGVKEKVKEWRTLTIKRVKHLCMLLTL